MLRALLLPLVSLMWISCGGEDESLAPPPVASTTAAVTMEVLPPLPTLDETKLAEALTAAALQAQAVETEPVEERFFYVVDVNAPAPTIPAPPCPSCR